MLRFMQARTTTPTFPVTIHMACGGLLLSCMHSCVRPLCRAMWPATGSAGGAPHGARPPVVRAGAHPVLSSKTLLAAFLQTKLHWIWCHACLHWTGVPVAAVCGRATLACTHTMQTPSYRHFV